MHGKCTKLRVIFGTSVINVNHFIFILAGHESNEKALRVEIGRRFASSFITITVATLYMKRSPSVISIYLYKLYTYQYRYIYIYKCSSKSSHINELFRMCCALLCIPDVICATLHNSLSVK